VIDAPGNRSSAERASPRSRPRATVLGALCWGAIFVALLFVHAAALTMPHHWDALNRLHNAHTIVANHFNPLLPAGITYLDAQGRPPLLLELLALTVLLAPYDLCASHILWIAFAALAVYMTYRLGRRFFHPLVGVIAALWLTFHPLFFAQSEVLALEVPLTALTIAAAVCLVERRPFLYIMTASFLVLAKEAGQFALPGLVLFAWWAAPRGERWRGALLAAAPFVASLAWMLVCKVEYGWFLYPFHSGLVRVEEEASLSRGLLLTLAYLGTRLAQVGFSEGNWTVTALALALLIIRRRHVPRLPDIAVALAIACAVYVTYPAALDIAQRVAMPASALASKSASMEEAWSIWAQLRLWIAMGAGLGWLALPGIGTVNWADARLWLLGGMVGGYAGVLAIVRLRMVRYMLPTYPFLFLIGAAALWQCGRRSRLITALVAAAVLLLFVSQYHGGRSGPGNVLETNLEFRDMIAVRRAATAYLEELAPRRVLAAWPETMELRFPYEGYVKHPLDVTEDVRGDADVLYVSPQSTNPNLAADLRRAIPGITLQPLLQVHRNGKSMDIYRIIRPHP